MFGARREWESYSAPLFAVAEYWGAASASQPAKELDGRLPCDVAATKVPAAMVNSRAQGGGLRETG